MFAMRRFHYIVVLVHTLYYYGGEEILFVTPWTLLYRGSLYLCCIAAAMIALIFLTLNSDRLFSFVGCLPLTKSFRKIWLENKCNKTFRVISEENFREQRNV